MRIVLASQFLQQLPGYADQLVDGFHHMDRYPDRPGLVGNGPGNRLADPPGGVGTEFKAFIIIELFNGFDQAEVPFLDQVQEQHAAAHIPFGNAYHQTQVRFRQAAFCLITLLFNCFQHRRKLCFDIRKALGVLFIRPVDFAFRA